MGRMRVLSKYPYECVMEQANGEYCVYYGYNFYLKNEPKICLRGVTKVGWKLFLGGVRPVGWIQTLLPEVLEKTCGKERNIVWWVLGDDTGRRIQKYMLPLPRSILRQWIPTKANPTQCLHQLGSSCPTVTAQ